MGSPKHISVSFGVAPLEVINDFKSFRGERLFTDAVRGLLGRAPRLYTRYKFRKLDKDAKPWKENLTVNEEWTQVVKQLDDFVSRSRLVSRAAGLEELLFAPLSK